MKDCLDEQTMALWVAREFEDGMIINLGFGIPTLAANFIPEDKEVIFHAENGCLGFGPTPEREEDEDFTWSTPPAASPRPSRAWPSSTIPSPFP